MDDKKSIRHWVLIHLPAYEGGVYNKLDQFVVVGFDGSVSLDEYQIICALIRQFQS